MSNNCNQLLWSEVEDAILIEEWPRSVTYGGAIIAMRERLEELGIFRSRDAVRQRCFVLKSRGLLAEVNRQFKYVHNSEADEKQTITRSISDLVTHNGDDLEALYAGRRYEDDPRIKKTVPVWRPVVNFEPTSGSGSSLDMSGISVSSRRVLRHRGAA